MDFTTRVHSPAGTVEHSTAVSPSSGPIGLPGYSSYTSTSRVGTVTMYRPTDDRLAAESLEKAQARLMAAGRDPVKAQAVPERVIDPSARIEAPKKAETKDDKDLKPEIIPAERSPIVSGVVMATVMGNAIYAYAVSPDTWDLMAYKQAYLDGGFEGFRLPNPRATIAAYAYGLPGTEEEDGEDDDEPQKGDIITIRNRRRLAFSTTCLTNVAIDDHPSVQVLPNRGNHRSYVMRATAFIMPAAMTKILTLTDVTIGTPMWMGPFNPQEGLLIKTEISRHNINGAWYNHTAEMTVSLPPANEAGPNGSLFELHFISTNGSKWVLNLVRLSS